jgi:hypothetical protein
MDGGREAGETPVSVLNVWQKAWHRRDRIVSVDEGRCTIRMADDNRSLRLQAGVSRRQGRGECEETGGLSAPGD